MSGGRRTKRSSTGRAMASRGAGEHRRGGPGREARIMAGVAAAAVVLAVVFLTLRTMLGGGSGSARPASNDAIGYARLGRAAETRHDDDAAGRAYREGLRRFPDDATLLGSYATAVKNRGFAVRLNRGRAVPVAATSHDRVRSAHEALELLAAAQRSRPGMSAPALQKGLLYAAWGLPEDALVELYGAASRGDPSPELEQTAGAITLLQLGRGNELDQKGNPASR